MGCFVKKKTGYHLSLCVVWQKRYLGQRCGKVSLPSEICGLTLWEGRHVWGKGRHAAQLMLQTFLLTKRNTACSFSYMERLDTVICASSMFVSITVQMTGSEKGWHIWKGWQRLLLEWAGRQGWWWKYKQTMTIRILKQATKVPIAFYAYKTQLLKSSHLASETTFPTSFWLLQINATSMLIFLLSKEKPLTKEDTME